MNKTELRIEHFDWNWINNTHTKRLAAEVFFIFQKPTLLVFIPTTSWFFRRSLYLNSSSSNEWLNGLWQKWNTLLLWIMEWHQKVFLRFSHSIDFKATASFLPLTLQEKKIFLQSLHWYFDSVTILRVWFFIYHFVLFAAFRRTFESLLWFIHIWLTVDRTERERDKHMWNILCENFCFIAFLFRDEITILKMWKVLWTFLCYFENFYTGYSKRPTLEWRLRYVHVNVCEWQYCFSSLCSILQCK